MGEVLLVRMSSRDMWILLLCELVWLALCFEPSQIG